MDKTPEGGPTGVVPTGRAILSEERLKLLEPQWEPIFRTMRRMDEFELGDTEPATLFVWGEVEGR